MRILIALLIAGMAAVHTNAAPSLDDQSRYFAGVFLITSAPGLSGKEKAMKYRELETVTGISTVRAQALLRLYRAKPAEWRELYDSIVKILDQVPAAPPAVTKKNTNAPVPSLPRR
jgi:hypothetical protein